jgi:hypothetical protein
MYLQIGAPNSPSTILAPNRATGTVRASPGSNLRRVLPAPVVLRTCLGLILSWRCERDSWLAFLPSHHYLNTRHYIERTLPRYHFARARHKWVYKRQAYNPRSSPLASSTRLLSLPRKRAISTYEYDQLGFVPQRQRKMWRNWMIKITSHTNRARRNRDSNPTNI